MEQQIPYIPNNKVKLLPLQRFDGHDAINIMRRIFNLQELRCSLQPTEV
jgi:hypothetical protein